MEVEETVKLQRHLVPYFEFFQGMLQPETAQQQQEESAIVLLATSPYARLTDGEWQWVQLVLAVHDERCTRYKLAPLESPLRQSMGWRLFSLERRFALLHAADFYGCPLLLALLLRKLSSFMRKAPIDDLMHHATQLQVGDFNPQRYDEQIAYAYARRMWVARQLALHWLGGNLNLVEQLAALWPRIGQLVGVSDTHQMCITRNGLMARGSSDAGELGVLRREELGGWTRVPHEGEPIAVCCGRVRRDGNQGEAFHNRRAFSLVLTTTGLYFCGHIENGHPLGYARSTLTRLPLPLAFQHGIPIAIACSESWILVATTNGTDCQIWYTGIDYAHDDEPDIVPKEWPTWDQVNLGGLLLSMQASRETMLFHTTQGLWAIAYGDGNSGLATGGPALLAFDSPVQSYGCDDAGNIVLTEQQMMVAGSGWQRDVEPGFHVMKDARHILHVGSMHNYYIVLTDDRRVNRYRQEYEGWSASRGFDLSSEPLALYCGSDHFAVLVEDGLLICDQMSKWRHNLLLGHEQTATTARPRHDRPEKRLKTQCLLCSREATHTDYQRRYRWCTGTCHDRFWAFQTRPISSQ